jgi:DNA-binding transcriptional regulator YdaS (Cro superfamily)
MKSKKVKELDRTLTYEEKEDAQSMFGQYNLDAFAKRMKVLVDHFGSIAKIAQLCGFSESTVKKWVDGVSDPSRGRCVHLARDTGVSLLWIATGEEPMWDQDRMKMAIQSQSQPMSAEALKITFQLVEEAAEGKVLSPEQRAELAALVYEGLVDGLPEAKILRWARAAAK